jgi:large subunit ribosomal protein L4
VQQDVVNLASEKVGTVELDDGIFAVAIRPDILARAVAWQLAKRRAGTHKVKGRSEVARTSKKPYKQKGTGRARQGSTKGPHMRGGGVVFGPTPRDHAHDLQKKVRRLALKTALSAKIAAGELVILDKAELDAPKTKVLAEQLQKLGWRRVLLIDGRAIETNFARAAQNIADLDVLPTQGANVYDILRHHTVVLTTAGVEGLTERLT